jgi:hypothetical protein
MAASQPAYLPSVCQISISQNGQKFTFCQKRPKKERGIAISAHSSCRPSPFFTKHNANWPPLATDRPTRDEEIHITHRHNINRQRLFSCTFTRMEFDMHAAINLPWGMDEIGNVLASEKNYPWADHWGMGWNECSHGMPIWQFYRN